MKAILALSLVVVAVGARAVEPAGTEVYPRWNARTERHFSLTHSILDRAANEQARALLAAGKTPVELKYCTHQELLDVRNGREAVLKLYLYDFLKPGEVLEYVSEGTKQRFSLDDGISAVNILLPVGKSLDITVRQR